VDPNPFFTNQVVLELTQPVLRDFGNQVNRARITIARNTQRISLLEFRKQLEETIADIEKTYWDLVQAERDVKIQEELLGRSIDTAVRLLARRDQDVTRVQISQTNSRIERRRAVLIDAKARVQDLSDRLKRDMNDPDLPVSSRVLILPGIKPVEEPIKFDLEDQINTAMENRFELGEQQFRVANAEEATAVGKNNLLPSLNVVGQIGLQGLDSDLSGSLAESYGVAHFNYSIGLQLEIPIGNRQARSIYQRALLQQQQAIMQYRSLIEQVSLDVKLGVRAVQTNWDKMVTARQATFAAADSLSAIEQRESANIEALTPTFIDLKLNQQEQLAEAQRAEAEAISQYNIAIAQLEQAKGTLLRYNNVVMEEQKQPFVKTLSTR
jgi:outer membrane protein TolC